jgi:hypothetical protein
MRQPIGEELELLGGEFLGDIRLERAIRYELAVVLKRSLRHRGVVGSGFFRAWLRASAR